jgi:hypothetical protein
MSTTPNPNVSLDQILNVLTQLQQENNQLRESFAQLQAQPPSVTPTYHPGSSAKPKISLPEKFDGSRYRFRGFLNQIRLVIQLHPHNYPTGTAQVGLIGTLLTGTALAWFAPLVEQSSPLLHNFDGFLSEFEATFGETDKHHTAANCIRTLRQRNRPAAVYAAEFRQLACDLTWNDAALIAQFRAGLQDEVKDLMLTMMDPVTLSEAIAQAVRCDNRLFERRQEKKAYAPQPPAPIPQALQVRPPVPATLPAHLGPASMVLDASTTRGPLSDAEKLRRRANHLCLYCGQPGHIVRACPLKRPAQANQLQVLAENFDTQLL